MGKHTDPSMKEHKLEAANFIYTLLPDFIKTLDQKLEENNQKNLISTQPTIADVVVQAVLTRFCFDMEFELSPLFASLLTAKS